MPVKRFFESYAALKGERNYWFYLISIVFSRLGDSIDALAYSWIAYQLTGSAVWLTVIVGVNALPTIFITPFVAPIVEKMNKKRVIVVTGLLRVALVFITGVLMVMNYLTAPLLLIATFIMSISESFSDPACMAAVPQIIPSEKMDVGLAFRTTTSQIAELLGAALGGICLAAFGGGGALITDAVLFLLATLMLTFLRLRTAPNEETQTHELGYLTALKDGFHYFIKRPTLVLLVMMDVSINLILSPINQLLTAYVVETLRLNAYALSVANIGSMVGMLLGSLIYPLLRSRLSLKRVVRIVGAAITLQYGVAVLISLPQNMVWMKYIGLFMILFTSALSISFFAIMTNVLFFKVIEEKYLSRMASIFNAFGMLAVPLASLMSGTLVSLLSIRKVFLFTTCVTVVLFLLLLRAKAMNELNDQVLLSQQQQTEETQNEAAL